MAYHYQAHSPDCTLRVGDRVTIADQWRYGMTGVIVDVNVAPHCCVQIRLDDGGLEYVLCPKVRVVESAVDRRRAEMFAGKWRADEHAEAPTDEALTAAFARCVKPPPATLYPAIRAILSGVTV